MSIMLIKIKIIAALLFCVIPSIAFANFQDELEAEIASDSGFENVVVNFHNGKRFSKEEGIRIVDVQYQRNSFIADCVSALGKNISISGSFEEAKVIPSLNKNKKVGELIEESDLEQIKVGISKLSNKAITSKEELLGKEARVNLYIKKTIFKNDIRSESVISKGDYVTILFAKNHLSIESKGQALESGGQDEVIRVKNLDSNKILQVRIVDSQTVLLGNS